ncbi:DUF72 domain-containing protein [Paracoccus shanxieyensis]|uniref:DUF72 domain-containing protein n=1 Tax=Paracoccus shanxieyensis TaxID=2675752 RepID=A0A6L6IZ25_9RHOB|nr:DUF72 domain-containing protein [Paracoccus shanxieyensis]MTH65765.1 DUF72 domain-containing protein [Paracoccus shanxieyensis]MTH88860.1 DUF72 domain-containing protein [Paracoccus shanxieyensis]
MGNTRIGIGGWTYEPWRGVFYPEGLAQKRELQHASRQLTSIEINSTYYGSQKPDSFRKWHDETPADFVFSLKAPRFATNRKVLAEAGESISRFFDSGVVLLGDKLGPINWQFMATKKFDAADFAAFLKLLPAEAGGLALRHAVEVRHDSFRVPQFVDLCRDHGVAIVVAGDGEFPQIADPTAGFIYARIMGTEAKRPQGYSRKALEQWADRARQWADGGSPDGLHYCGSPAPELPRDVFLYVISGAKERNPQAAMALIDLLGQKD